MRTSLLSNDLALTAQEIAQLQRSPDDLAEVPQASGLEVADVIRRYGPEYLERFGAHTNSDQRRALRDLANCRTAALGGHLEQCDACGHRRCAYNSCRNRNCPKCQGAARAQWLADRSAELLPVEYFHVVFTLPSQLHGLALHNPRPIYQALFQAMSQTMLQVAANPDQLGARLGFFGLLHTWGQNLHLHPHIHCVVPGGGIAPDGQRWISCYPGFFLPVRLLGKVFRGKFLHLLGDALAQNRLRLTGSLLPWNEPRYRRERLEELRHLNWIVYAKPPFGGPHTVLRYLARYTHRVAISNRRLIDMDNGQVHFHYKDYRDGQAKTMRLDALEFIGRFLQHVMPRGLCRIRSYGWLANRHRQVNLERCRRLLAVPPPTPSPAPDPPLLPSWQRCPCCGRGNMIAIEKLPPTPRSSGAGSTTPTSPRCSLAPPALANSS